MLCASENHSCRWKRVANQLTLKQGDYFGLSGWVSCDNKDHLNVEGEVGVSVKETSDNAT